MQSEIKNYFSKDGLLKATLIILGLLIVSFNVMGYNILFKDEPIIWIITPIAILFCIAELSVLLWTSSILKNWRKTKTLLKAAMFVVVPIFALMSFTGINSYLNTLATSDYVDVQKVRLNESNKQKYIAQLQPQIDALRSNHKDFNVEKNIMQMEIQKLTTSNTDLSIKISERMAAEKRGQCQKFQDCATAVSLFKTEIQKNNDRKARLAYFSQEKTKQIDNLSKEIDLITTKLNTLISQILEGAISVSGVESEFENKKKIYESIVIKIAGWFGIVVDNPFAVFVAFISGIVYPIYFLINLYLGLSNNDSAREKEEIYQLKQAQRKEKLSRKKSYYQLRSDIWKNIYKLMYLRTQFSRRKFKLSKEHSKLKFIQKSEANLEAIKQKNIQEQQKITFTASMLLRAIRYFRVWAYSRKKTRNIKIETIKNVEVEIEVEIIKEVEVIKEIEVEKEIEVIKIVEKEVRIEVPIYVDKIVEVPTEKPVYVEKIVKVTEEKVVIEKETVVNEVLIMVPENISAVDLEILLDEHRQGKLAADASYNISSKIA
jgi:hypothetical protein